MIKNPKNQGIHLPVSRELTSARRLMRQLVEISNQNVEPQKRLDGLVKAIARQLIAEVCSLYVRRAGDALELFATEGLVETAVHRTRLRVGEGLVGTIAVSGGVLVTDNAREHPKFSFRPEVGEEPYNSFLGVPIVRSGSVIGVLVVQNLAHKHYQDDEIEAMQVVATLLAELLSTGGVIDKAVYTDFQDIERATVRLTGRALVDGMAVGTAWIHKPQLEVKALVSDDPDREIERLEQAQAKMHEGLDRAFERSNISSGEGRDILEAIRMIAKDRSWGRRIREAILSGLSAEAGVLRVQEETRIRLGQTNDPYLRERLIDLEDIADRLLMHLTGRDMEKEAKGLPDKAILVAKNLSAADLIEYDHNKIQGVILEEGSKNAHVTLIARSFDLPMIGQVERATALIEAGDYVAIDGSSEQALVRPSEDIIEAFQKSVRSKSERDRELELLRDKASVTADGVHVSISINAAFLIDMVELDNNNADGVGLFRTEMAFMSRPGFTNSAQQFEFYKNVVDLAQGRPVRFRTMDIGSDKSVPFLSMPDEANPAMGWRAMRMVLDRPALLRAQLRALVEACAGQKLEIMFPMVAELAEFRAAASLLEAEILRAKKKGKELPTDVSLGVMLEVPALFWQLDHLLKEVDFLSVGSNDLVQFLFACDRSSPFLHDRYDVLSPPFMRFLRELVLKCRENNVTLSVCGEMASVPIEAMALIGLGIRHLSVSPAQVQHVKRMLRSMKASDAHALLARLMDCKDHSLRNQLNAYAIDHGVDLPKRDYISG